MNTTSLRLKFTLLRIRFAFTIKYKFLHPLRNGGNKKIMLALDYVRLNDPNVREKISFCTCPLWLWPLSWWRCPCSRIALCFWRYYFRHKCIRWRLVAGEKVVLIIKYKIQKLYFLWFWLLRYDNAGNEADKGIIPSKQRWESRLRSREKNVRYLDIVMSRVQFLFNFLFSPKVGQQRFKK